MSHGVVWKLGADTWRGPRKGEYGWIPYHYNKVHEFSVVPSIFSLTFTLFSSQSSTSTGSRVFLPLLAHCHLYGSCVMGEANPSDQGYIDPGSNQDVPLRFMKELRLSPLILVLRQHR